MLTFIETVESLHGPHFSYFVAFVKQIDCMLFVQLKSIGRVLTIQTETDNSLLKRHRIIQFKLGDFFFRTQCWIALQSNSAGEIHIHFYFFKHYYMTLYPSYSKYFDAVVRFSEERRCILSSSLLRLVQTTLHDFQTTLDNFSLKHHWMIQQALDNRFSDSVLECTLVKQRKMGVRFSDQTYRSLYLDDSNLSTVCDSS